MKKKWEIIILTTIVLIMGVGVLSPVFSQWDGGGAFGSITNYLKQVMTSIISNANNTYNLGAASKRFSNAYIVSANFADGTSQTTAATGASSNGNSGAIQFAGSSGTFASDAANFSYNSSSQLLTVANLKIPTSAGNQTDATSARMRIANDYLFCFGSSQENLYTYRVSGISQRLLEIDMVHLGDETDYLETGALVYDTVALAGTTKFDNFNSPNPVYLTSVGATSGNFIGFSLGMENQYANASTPFVRIHSLKGNTANNSLTTPETMPSFEIGDQVNLTSLPANADNGSLVVDRHIAALEGGAANGACCFMADGKTLGHCTGLVGANGTCTCAD